jgi:hypothetical protein
METTKKSDENLMSDFLETTSFDKVPKLEDSLAMTQGDGNDIPSPNEPQNIDEQLHNADWPKMLRKRDN